MISVLRKSVEVKGDQEGPPGGRLGTKERAFKGDSRIRRVVRGRQQREAAERGGGGGRLRKNLEP